MAIDQITTGVIKDNAVTSAKIPAGAIEIADVADDAITSAKIAAGAVDATALGSNAVTTVKINADAIDGTKLADNAVNSEHVTAGAIDTAHIGDDQVTGAKIENNPTIAGNLSAGGNLAVTGKTTLTGDLIPSEQLTHRNLIINGSMQVWQKKTSAVAAGANTYDTVDRWCYNETSDGAFTSERHTMSLAEINTTGHAYALKLLCTTADSSVAAGHHASFMQHIEAGNLQHLRYGTAAAKTLTLSFWVKSNKTGTYVVSFDKPDSTAYRIPIEYSISSADTWEQKTITITPTAGSTSLITSAAGVITNDTGIGLTVRFGLLFGSDFNGTNNTWVSTNKLSTSNQVNWLDSTSNNFYITGVQLELGSNATPFEHLSYDEQIQKCWRYLYTTTVETTGAGRTSNTDGAHGTFFLPTTMRATPTLGFGPNQTASNFRILATTGQKTGQAAQAAYNFNGNSFGIHLLLLGSGHYSDAHCCTFQLREGYSATAELT